MAGGILAAILVGTVVVVSTSAGRNASAVGEKPIAPASLPSVSPPPPSAAAPSEQLVSALKEARSATRFPACLQIPDEGKVVEVWGTAAIQVVLGDCGVDVAYAGVRGFEQADIQQEALARNIALVSGRQVRLEADKSGVGASGVLYRHVFVDGLLVSEQLVRYGVLRVDTESADVRYRDRLSAAEEEAKRARRGGWKLTPETAVAESPIAKGPKSPFEGAIQLAAIDPIGEVVSIVNEGAEAVDLSGWTLSASKSGAALDFADGTKIEPGQTLQIVSGVPNAPASRLFWTPDPVWADDRSDAAELRDSGGLLVAKYP